MTVAEAGAGFVRMALTSADEPIEPGTDLALLAEGYATARRSWHHGIDRHRTARLMTSPPPVSIPPALAQNVVETWGGDGAEWLEELPDLLAAIARDWELPAGTRRPVPNEVPLGRRGDSDRRDRGGPQARSAKPGHLATQAAALRTFAGHGAVRLIAYDADRGALLLERATPARSCERSSSTTTSRPPRLRST